MCARFATNANRIGARWTTSSGNLAMPHMPATGVSGLDLYVNDAGVWRWIGNGRPAAQTNEQTLADGIPDGWHEYIVYFPLYNGLTSLEIGVPPETALAQPPARAAGREKPMVFYGTSILQGGCASRPGMAHTSILGRWLDRPTLNFGFSGNGKMEMELEALLAELDASVYVLDCIPNMGSEMVTERLKPFVMALRQARPDTPIVLVENIHYQAGAFLPAARTAYESKNQALKEAYARLVAQGVAGLTYVPCDNLLGDDGEATVDGTHCTDLGYYRMAETLEPVLRNVLEP
jgi:lysophospholipase L1-like esterase